MSMYLTPLEVLKHLIGREEVLGRICGVNDKAPYGWARPAKHRDAGDIPFSRYQRRLLAYSDARGLGLTARHLIDGATLEEVEEILAARGGEVGNQVSGTQEVAA